MTNAKQKGNRGEREASKLLISLGLTDLSRRSCQYSGSSLDDNSADIITNIEGIRFEIKSGYDTSELWSKEVTGWVEKARQETADYDNWVVLWRRTRKKWVILFDWNGVVCCSYDIAGVVNKLRKN